MKPYPWKCGTCLERGLAPATIDYETTRVHDGREFPIRVLGLDVLKCGKCGAIVLSDAADERVYEQLRCAAGILSPDEIRRHRETIGLTVKDLARLVREHEATVARWESGGQLQNRPMDLLLRLLFKLPEVRKELGGPRNSNGIAEGTAAQAHPIAS